MLRPRAFVAASPSTRRHRRAEPWLVLGLLFLGARETGAQEVVSASPDVTITVGGSALEVRDDEVVLDNRLGVVLPEALVGIPQTTDVTAYARVGSSYAVAFETTTALPDGVVARPRDVALYDAPNAAHSLLLDGSADGLPDGLGIDALSFSWGGLLLSFDRTVEVGGLVVADEDLVRWIDGTFSLAFDASMAGVEGSLDVDGVQELGGGDFLLSFDTTGSLDGIVFHDEDVIRFEGGVWSLEFDASASEPSWIAADLDAVTVPEPRVGTLLIVGFFALGGASRRRSRPSVGWRRAACLVVGSSVLIAPGAGASEGRLEISHACATGAGCGPGDVPGYPVTITGAAPRSAVLTSDLRISDGETTGIEILATDVTVDMAGFSIIRSDCVGATVDCTLPTSSGLGIDSVTTGARGSRIHDGSVVGFNDGIALGAGSETSNVRARWNRFVGIGSTGRGSLIFDSTALENGEYGIVPALNEGGIAIGNRSVRNSVGVVAFGRAHVVIDNVVLENEIGGLANAGVAVMVGNSSYRNGGTGLNAASGEAAVVEGNAVYDNDNGISGDDETLVRGNVSRNHAGYGLFLGSQGGYRENSLTNNAGGDVTGGLNLGDNACTGATPCP
jgi:hypothetical protein